MTQSSETTSATAPLSPLWVGIAILALPPFGYYLLWNHPTLRKSTAWWVVGLVWGVAWGVTNTLGSRATSATDSETVASATASNDGANNRGTDSEISARDLMELGNSAAIRNKFPGRFVVVGEVLQVEDESGSFGRRQYKVSLVGTLNARGLCNKWVQCLMSHRDGLDQVSRGDFVRIEGTFDRAMGSCVYMKNCKLPNQ
jgi:hypothetical protein